MGYGTDEVNAAYLSPGHQFRSNSNGVDSVLAAPLSKSGKAAVAALKEQDSRYRFLDPTVHFAMLAARKAVKLSNWKPEDVYGINIGSSRGATQLFEKSHKQFLEEGKVPVKTSPRTTSGNISSWVAQDLQAQGPALSHSITCSTSLHAVLNAVAWIKSGMVSKFVVGGSEAALTPYTIAQMQALNIYSRDVDAAYPCRPLDLSKKQNTMILGEGAAIACIEHGVNERSLATIEGCGYATETIDHGASISAEAESIQKAMKMALENVELSDIDMVILHAPGTVKGDQAEVKAIEAVFGENSPFLTSNKWKTGHTFAPSGMLSIEMAIAMMKNEKALDLPYLEAQVQPDKIKKVLVNSVGFGGNAVSILLAAV